MAERQVTIKILGDATKAKQAFTDAGTAATTFEGKIEGAGSKFGSFASTMTGFLAAGAVQQFGGWLKDGAQGAADDAAAMDGLRQAVTNTGASYDDYSKQIDDAIKKSQSLAFTDGETADALALLTSLTGDSDEALRRLSTAQDLARGTGMDLQTAAKLLGKVSDENTAVLSRYGIAVEKGATAQDVMNQVDAKFGGRAATFAEGDAGKWLKFQQQLGEVQESIGGMLIPALTTLALVLSQVTSALDPVIAFIGDHFIPIALALGTAILTALVPAAITFATTLLTVTIPAMAATVVAFAPVLAVAAAVGLAVAALYLAWQSNFLNIQGITQQVLDFILPYIQTAMSAIQTVVETVWPIIATVVTTYITILRTEIELALAAVQAVWGVVFPAIQAVVETVFPIVATVATTYMGILRTEVEAGVTAAKWAFDNIFVPIQGIVSDVFTTIQGIVSSVWDPTVTAIGVGVDTVKTMFDGIVSIQGIVSDVFTTIQGLVSDLWTMGAVLDIASGLGTLKSLFSGVYDTFYGYGADIMQGLIDGIKSLYNTLKGWIDDIGGLLEIDVPGFSPPYDAGYKQGRRFMQGLVDGIGDGRPGYERTLGAIGAGMGTVGSDGTSPYGGPGVIGDAASGRLYPTPGIHNGSRRGGSASDVYGALTPPFLDRNLAFSGGSQYGSAQGARGMLSDPQAGITQAVADGMVTGWARVMNGSVRRTSLLGRS